MTAQRPALMYVLLGKSWRVDSRIPVPGTAFWHGRGMSTGGRPSKGDRYAAKTRLPRPVADAVWALHDETGAAVSDIIARFVALGLGMPDQAPALPEAFNQEELQLKTA